MAAVASVPHVGSFVSKIETILDDPHFQKMLHAFTKTGKGAPPKVDRGPLTHKLALQLELLRMKTGRTWNELETFFPRVVSGDPLKGLSLRTEIEATVNTARKLASDDNNFRDFLNVDLGQYILGRNVGFYLLKHRISRQHLLNPSSLEQLQTPTELVNGVVVDIVAFANKEREFTVAKSRKVLEFFGAKLEIESVTDQQLSARLKNIYGHYLSLNKSVKKPNGVEKMNLFLSACPEFTKVSVPVPGPSSCAWHAPDNIKLASAERTQAMLRRQLEDAKADLALQVQQNSALQEQIHQHCNKINQLEEERAEQERRIAEMKSQQVCVLEEKATLQTNLQESRNEVARIRKTAYYRRLKRKEQYLRNKEEVIIAHKNCTKQIMILRKKIKNEQTKLSCLKARHNHMKARKDAEIHHWKETAEALSQQPEESKLKNIDCSQEQAILRLKDDRGHFIPDAIVCVMKLIGEHEVPSRRCGEIIQAVVRILLDAHVPDSDLPSMRSAVRFADRGQVISKVHVTEHLLEAERFDLHTDGTSRSGKKYLSQQVTTPESTLCTGFATMSTENTETLLSQTMNLLHELSDIYNEEQADATFTQLLKNLSGLMSDRAAVNKSFGRALDAERKTLLRTEEDLMYLYCNAHYLLGLSAACEKSLKAEEPQPLGRDMLPCFRSFKNSTESAAQRYIRLGCDCLGPRGDDKNGCRDLWETHCLMTGVNSVIKSFRSNRFNNYFESAAALHFHREDVRNCLAVLPRQNRKIQSVAADNLDDGIDNRLVALGIMYYRLTGPYWELLARNIHCLDFAGYVVELHSRLRQWSAHPVDMFAGEFEPLFGMDFMPNPAVFQSLLDIAPERKEEVQVLLQGLCSACLQTTERQLTDFLPGGRYHGVQDEQLRQRLQHSKLTNLIGEQVFGDLDFSLFKRRSASVHHHSTINMLKRNRSISEFLLTKTPEQQQQLLQLSAKKANSLRKKHQEEATEAVVQRQHILEESRAQKEAVANRLQAKIAGIVNTVQEHNGPCASHVDVDRLLTTCQTAVARLKAVKAEIQFQKLVYNRSSPLLKVTGKLPQLVQRLKLFLGADEAAANVLPPLPKRRRVQMPDIEDSDNAASESEDDVTDSDSSVTDTTGHQNDQTLQHDDFRFQQQGQLVAVYFFEDFYIGEVTEIENEQQAVVNYMEKTNFPADGEHPAYRWPRSKDLYSTAATYVFAHDLILEPVSTSGRSFVVANAHDLSARYRAFKIALASQ